jgi:hypothetical protein
MTDRDEPEEVEPIELPGEEYETVDEDSYPDCHDEAAEQRHEQRKGAGY